jgi:hypothetical protein
MNKKTIIAALLFLLPLTVSAEPLVTLDFDRARAVIGDTVIAHLSLKDFPATEGGGVHIDYDASILEVSGIVIDSDVWSFASGTGEIDNDAGSVRNLYFARFPGVSGNLPVATITFRATGKGQVRPLLRGSEINPFASAGEPVQVSYESGRLMVKTGSGKTSNSNSADKQ